MKSFITYIREAKGGVSELSPKVITLLSKKLKGVKVEELSSTKKMTTIRVTSPNRVDDKEKSFNLLSKSFKEILLDSPLGGSLGSLELIEQSGHKIRVIFKPKSGGFTETTLNSTITELVPAILFMERKFSFTKSIDVLNYLLENKTTQAVYVNSKDAKAGEAFIKQMIDSSKFDEKMQNALGVLKYLREQESIKPIKNVFWGYREKPVGISSKHKGDIFIEFQDGTMLGVSLKAGGAKTNEPKLNTFVNAVMQNLGRTTELSQLKDDVYNNIHQPMGLPKGWKPTKHIDIITAFRESNSPEYVLEHYNKMLEMVRDRVVEAFGADKDNTLDFIKEQILGTDAAAPLVVVKAIKNNFKMLTEEDDLEAFLPLVTSVKAYEGGTKQKFHIELMSNSGKLILNMSIRTNKSQPLNKLAQGFNLAIKFNSLSK